ncbi:MAG TPA: GNAT family N-acetyltransferase, partial [Nitriliruptorales bacterium]
MPVTLRTPDADDMPGLARVFFDGLGRPRVDDHLTRYQRLLEPKRCLVVVDGERVVGSAVSTPTSVAMPGGGTARGAIVTGVAVQPTHRRQGWLRRMMHEQLAALRDAGEVVAVLRATEGAIY